jgi:aryl-alcohol dehydrogenase-like predicted oxidoreductase
MAQQRGQSMAQMALSWLLKDQRADVGPDWRKPSGTNRRERESAG